MSKYFKIGKFKIHPIGIGTWGIGGFMEPIRGNEEKEIKAIRYSIKKGQNHIDTAEMYGNGHSEEVVAEALKGIGRNKIFIASKIHRNYTQAKDVIRSTEKILKRLKIKKLDMLYIHAYWEDAPMLDYLKEVNKALEKGLTKTIAVSNFNTKQLKWAISESKNKIVANQMNYNLLHKIEVPEDMKKLCVKEDIALVAYRPVERGLLADDCENEIVLKLTKKYKKTPAQIAINWLINQKNVITIPKSTNPKHIDENLEAINFKISKSDMELLNKI